MAENSKPDEGELPVVLPAQRRGAISDSVLPLQSWWNQRFPRRLGTIAERLAKRKAQQATDGATNADA